MPAYDRNVFGIEFPRRAFDIVHLMPDRVLDDGTVKKGFETYKRAAEEDEKRIKMLLAHGSLESVHLAEELRRGIDRPDAFQNMASAVWMRRFRMKLIGIVLEKLHPYANSDLWFVTLINKKWIINTGELHWRQPKYVMEEFRQHLNRVGATAAPGVLFAWLHGEFDPLSRCYRLHVHCVCSTEKAEAIRKIQNEQRWGYETVDGIKKPIQFHSIKVSAGERERATSYAFQQFWPQRPAFTIRSESHGSQKSGDEWCRLLNERFFFGWRVSVLPIFFFLSQTFE